LRESIKLRLLVPHPNNPNGDRMLDGIEDLAQSITEVGLLHPLHVVPIEGTEGYHVIAGCRRLMALPSAGYAPDDEIECYCHETGVDIEGIRFVENEQRRSVHPLVQAERVCAMLERSSARAVADHLGESPHRIRQLQSISNMPAEVKKLYEDESLTWGHMRLLAQVQDSKELVDFANDWCETDWNGATPLDRCRQDLMKEVKLLSKAPWKLDDSDLPNGACSECQYNTDKGDFLFEELGDKARCTNQGCFDEKGRAYQDVRMIQLEEAGEAVMNRKNAKGRVREYKPNGWVPLSMSLGVFNQGAPTKGRTTLKTLVGKDVKPWTYIPLDDYSLNPHARRLVIEKVLIEKGLATNAALGYTDDYRPGDPIPKSKEGQSKEKEGERRAKQNQKVVTEVAFQMQQAVAELEPDAFHAAMCVALGELVSCVDPLAMNKYGKAHNLKLAEGESSSRYSWGSVMRQLIESKGTTEQVAMLLELVVFSHWPAKYRPELPKEIKEVAKVVGIKLAPIIALSKEKKLPKKS